MAGLVAVLDRGGTAGKTAAPPRCGRLDIQHVPRPAQRCVPSRGTLHSSRMKCTNGRLLAAHAAWRAACAAKASGLVRDVCGLSDAPRDITSQN